jgi:hypothetical protein
LRECPRRTAEASAHARQFRQGCLAHSEIDAYTSIVVIRIFFSSWRMPFRRLRTSV